MDTVRTTVSTRSVRALHDAETITVYQAFGPLIAEPALRTDGFRPASAVPG